MATTAWAASSDPLQAAAQAIMQSSTSSVAFVSSVLEGEELGSSDKSSPAAQPQVNQC